MNWIVNIYVHIKAIDISIHIIGLQLCIVVIFHMYCNFITMDKILFLYLNLGNGFINIWVLYMQIYLFCCFKKHIFNIFTILLWILKIFVNHNLKYYLVDQKNRIDFCKNGDFNSNHNDSHIHLQSPCFYLWKIYFYLFLYLIFHCLFYPFILLHAIWIIIKCICNILPIWIS